MNVAALFIKIYIRQIVLLATTVVLLSVFSTLAFEENDGIPKAAIIDQLYDRIRKILQLIFTKNFPLLTMSIS